MLLPVLLGALSTVATQSPPSTVQPVPELSIEGRVVGEQGEPMPRMHILLSRPGETGIVSTPSLTNEQGAFKLSGLTPGEYRICADPGPNLAVIRATGDSWVTSLSGPATRYRYRRSRCRASKSGCGVVCFTRSAVR